MKIYFAGSIRGGRDDKELYLRIIKHLQSFGTVLTEHIGDNKLSKEGEKDFTDEEIYKRDKKWLSEADVVVAEVTNPSLGVGYELGIAEREGKEVVCLYRASGEKRLSAMISGNRRFKVLRYDSLEECFRGLDNFLGARN